MALTFTSSSGVSAEIVGEVEAQPVRLHQGARLMDMVAQHRLQCRLQQMGRGVGAA